jgi:hypothetical protein
LNTTCEHVISNFHKLFQKVKIKKKNFQYKKHEEKQKYNT